MACARQTLHLPMVRRKESCSEAPGPANATARRDNAAVGAAHSSDSDHPFHGDSDHHFRQRTDHWPERCGAGFRLSAVVIGMGQRSACRSHGFSCQVEWAGVVDEPVEDGVSEGRIPDP